MLGNARAYRFHPAAVKITPDAWQQLMKTIKRLKTSNISLIIYTLILLYTVVLNKKILKLNMFTLKNTKIQHVYLND